MGTGVLDLALMDPGGTYVDPGSVVGDPSSSTRIPHSAFVEASGTGTGAVGSTLMDLSVGVKVPKDPSMGIGIIGSASMVLTSGTRDLVLDARDLGTSNGVLCLSIDI